MKTILLLVLALLVQWPLQGAPPVKPADEQLRTKIVGVWFGEELVPPMRHVGQRSQYFPDGRFACDSRLSSPGGEHYIRNIGRWTVNGGVFSDTTTSCSDPVKIPTLIRHVVVIDHGHMILETDNGTRFEMWRGPFELETGGQSLTSVNHKRLFEELMAMHVSGYRLVPAGKGYSSIRFDTRVTAKPAPNKP